MPDQSMVAALRSQVLPLRTADDLDAVLEHIGEASLVMMGEASHGTREFYQLRADLSKRLIVEQGFDAIAVEADWPDALQVSRYVQLAGGDRDADQALSGFERFPQWMWRNEVVLDLVNWMRAHNRQVSDPARRVGFYGLDLYSLRKSMHAVVQYLEYADPEAALRARQRYSCFDHLAGDPQHYGYAVSFGMKPDCEEQVVRQLVELTENVRLRLAQPGGAVPDDLFYAQQNARVARGAETYYRAMFSSRDQSWNVRDTHMADALDALRVHLSRAKGGTAKILVWAHNSHLGDASATEMGQLGQVNLGQLMRERCASDEVYLLGFTTHDGTVTAGSEWDGPAELKRVLPSRPDSIEHLLHQVAEERGLPPLQRFVLPIRGNETVRHAMPSLLLERAIGVVYRPETERASHYFNADVAWQFDGLIHVDHSTAVKPLEYSAHWSGGEMPETYPSGL